MLLQRPAAFHTTITEKLIVYASSGSVDVSSGTPETLTDARRILRSTNPRWSALIAAVAQQGLPRRSLERRRAP